MTTSAQAEKTAAVVGFGLTVFMLGLGIGMLTPLIVTLSRSFHQPLGSVVLFISLLGFLSLLLSFPASYLTARAGASVTIKLAAACLAAGLLLRALAPGYGLFLTGQILVCLVMPLCYGSIGSILRSAAVRKLRLSTGLVIGAMPFGVTIASSTEALLARGMGLAGTFWLAFALSVAVGVYAWITSSQIPRADHGIAPPRLTFRFNRWLIVSFCIFGIANVLTAIIAPAVLHLHLPNAFVLAGVVGAMTSVGGFAVSWGLGFAGDVIRRPVVLIRTLSLVAFVFIGWVALMLGGQLPASYPALLVGAFLWGGTCYAIFALLNAEVAHEAASQGQAGVETAGISAAGNIGGALIQQFLGPLVVVNGVLFAGSLMVLTAVAAVVSFWPQAATRAALRTSAAR